jgi:alpha-tubulin suppressor-like RCC1 family protein
MLGVINQQREISVLTPEKDLMQYMGHVAQAVYSQSSLFILTDAGTVYQYDSGAITELSLPPVTKISGSPTGVLFLTQTGVYGLGSNKLAQLGMDYQQQQVLEPTLIEYFCGFQHMTDIDCGPFHSAVIADGEVYTFGWSKEGRLGWGLEEKEDIISYATFLDVNNQPVDIHAVQVACGASHTLVLDGNYKTPNKYTSIS